MSDKPTLAEWDEDAEDWERVFTDEDDDEFWAEEAKRSEQQLREAGVLKDPE